MTARARIIAAFIAILSTLPGNAKAAQERPEQDMVVILHGLGNTRWNMYGIDLAMKKSGYDTLNITCPSLKKDIPELAAFVRDRLEKEKIWNRPGHVHFVTHSMGGLIARRYLEEYRNEIPLRKMGRVVMIAPPNGGSEIADFLKNFPPYKWVFGPSGQQLGTRERQADHGAPWYDTGIVAGTKGWIYPIASLIMPDGNDGRVAVESTKMNGMKDFIALPATHSFIVWKPTTHEMIVNFLKNGEFRHG